MLKKRDQIFMAILGLYVVQKDAYLVFNLVKI